MTLSPSTIVMRGCSRARCAEHLGDEPAGLRAAGVDDAAAGVAALAREPLVELDAEGDEVGDAGRSLPGEELDRALAAEAAAGGERVGRVEGGIVVGADGSGDAALRGPAVRGVEGALREDADGRPCVRRREGGGEAGDPGADDRQIRVQFLPQRR